MKVVKKDALNIIGIPLRTDIHKAPSEISKHWERFYTQKIIDQIPNKIGPSVYAIYTDYEGDYTKPYTLIIGCEVTPEATPPLGFVFKHIPSASYNQISVKGDFPQSLISAWEKVWQSSMPRAYTSDFEFYGPDFEKDQSLDLYIAVDKGNH